jgi:hypothetical protein
MARARERGVENRPAGQVAPAPEHAGVVPTEVEAPSLRDARDEGRGGGAGLFGTGNRGEVVDAPAGHSAVANETAVRRAEGDGPGPRTGHRPPVAVPVHVFAACLPGSRESAGIVVGAVCSATFDGRGPVVVRVRVGAGVRRRRRVDAPLGAAPVDAGAPSPEELGSTAAGDDQSCEGHGRLYPSLAERRRIPRWHSGMIPRLPRLLTPHAQGRLHGASGRVNSSP